MAKESTQLKGKLEITLDEKKLEAKLVFAPDENGEVWERDKILALCRKHDIQQKVDAQKLDDTLSVFGSLAGPEASGVIATGALPEEPVHETVDWADPVMPEELKESAERCLKVAPPPVVYDIQIRKVKIEETVAKKAAMPFLKPKVEIVTKWKKEEIRTEVPIESEAYESSYVKEGDVIAKHEPGKPGKPGADLFGKPIAPEKPQKINLYYGEGVQKNGNLYKAAVSGFLRRGREWLDVVAFAARRLNIYASPDNAICLLDFEPGVGPGSSPGTDPGDGDLPSPAVILDQAKELGFNAETLLTEEKISSLLSEAVSSQTPIKALSLDRPSDSSIEVVIDPDRLKATLSLRKESGKGKPLTLKAIGEAIKRANLKGMDINRVKPDILEFFKGDDTELLDYLLVEGRAPAPGADGELQLLVEFKSEAETAAIRGKTEGGNREGSFPLESVTKTALVEKGQKLAKISPAAVGGSGQDVNGDALDGIKGQDPNYELFDGVKVAGTDLVAVLSGLLEIGEQDGKMLIGARSYQEAEIAVRISEDQMQGFVTLVPPQGTGESISASSISEAMENGSIVKGINSALIMELARKAQGGQPVAETPVAEGLPPRHGSGNRLRFHVAITTGGSLYAAAGTADSVAKSSVKSAIKKDDLLAEILPPSVAPRDGWRVTGEAVAANAGSPIDIETGANVRKEEIEDGTLKFFAEKNGEVFYDGNLLDIKDTMVFKGNVSKRTGNIKFSGTVEIEGSIEEGSRVFSGGDIKVGDSVSGSILSSDGSIRVQNGVIGAGKTVLRSKGEIDAAFIEEAMVLSVGKIRIRNSCLRCNVKCNDKMSLDTEKGTLVGGAVKSKKGIELINLGSDNGTRTEISFGQDYLVSDQIELEEREIEKLKKRSIQCDMLLKKFENGASPDPAKLAKIRKEKLMALKIMEKRSIRLFNLKEKFEEHFPSEIIIKGDVYPGVVFESHGRFHEIDTQKKNLTIFFDSESGKIVEKDLKDN